MKKTILACLILLLFIPIVSAHDRSPTAPFINFARITTVSHTPAGGVPTEERVIDINGYNLYPTNELSKTVVRFFGPRNTPAGELVHGRLTILSGTQLNPNIQTINKQQLIVRLPSDIIPGTYPMTVTRKDGENEFEQGEFTVTIGAVEPQGPAAPTLVLKELFTCPQVCVVGNIQKPVEFSSTCEDWGGETVACTALGVLAVPKPTP